MNRSTEVTIPIGRSSKVPTSPKVDTTSPAKIGPKKKPVFPDERKIPIALPLDLLLVFTTEEKAGG